MNRKNLNQIFDAYIQHFELLNDSRNDESHTKNLYTKRWLEKSPTS